MDDVLWLVVLVGVLWDPRLVIIIPHPTLLIAGHRDPLLLALGPLLLSVAGLFELDRLGSVSIRHVTGRRDRRVPCFDIVVELRQRGGRHVDRAQRVVLCLDKLGAQGVGVGHPDAVEDKACLPCYNLRVLLFLRGRDALKEPGGVGVTSPRRQLVAGRQLGLVDLMLEDRYHLGARVLVPHDRRRGLLSVLRGRRLLLELLGPFRQRRLGFERRPFGLLKDGLWRGSLPTVP
mmetsp:Transcript_31150/g.81664  ORF Transcript_31150/g.81664 Transcript_31150/m.81664 type:complete len:233 (-) Transcript_31150:573-1271(-)